MVLRRLEIQLRDIDIRHDALFSGIQETDLSVHFLDLSVSALLFLGIHDVLDVPVSELPGRDRFRTHLSHFLSTVREPRLSLRNDHFLVGISSINALARRHLEESLVVKLLPLHLQVLMRSLEGLLFGLLGVPLYVSSFDAKALPFVLTK